MRLVIQRVKNARVRVNGEVVGQVNSGLFVLLGVGQNDKVEHADGLAEKVVNMRIMADEQGKMNLSVKDTGGEVLVVSQFTLYADSDSGRRPSFIKAAPPELAKKVYERFIERVKGEGVSVKTGNFGEYMEIESIADGPVTILVEKASGNH